MRLAFVLPNLLTWDGERKVVGGLERLAWALLEVARDTGYQVEVHQYGSADWQRVVDGIPIRGHGLARLHRLAAWESIHHATGRVVYLSLMQETTVYRPGSLVVAHGVWWDTPGADVPAQLEAVRSALEQPVEVVAVDYNFPNVVRAVYPALAGRIRVIPNFADTARFRPPPARNGPPLVLFPRRLDPARGAELFLDAVTPLLAEFPQARFRMAVDDNRGYPELAARVAERLAAPPLTGRVELAPAPFEAMPALYAAADIVVIPSTFSEGTAFSCLEAMAAGCAVVASEVGGLTNLVIPGFNGILVPPRAPDFTRALAQLLTDAALRRRLGAAARATAEALGHERWRRMWAETLLRVYGPPVREEAQP
ncbi:Glycosyltransferase [Candidatus Hydrogenisulfobacillus filiaventi]|uniref:Glycosyltransferase n=1 Tax=Candidatus Hydrogenisulfobacillus filiaventi TaxID=2707344 RepID=A0A6F8ZD78_9FIRM|nr:glycosyltransferase family 4 protein [Bacillota bacterium]CAB1127828.1 Glycosyltransferase [Candidatus Hydrogenisulfobacillus filiaventi]